MADESQAAQGGRVSSGDTPAVVVDTDPPPPGSSPSPTPPQRRADRRWIDPRRVDWRRIETVLPIAVLGALTLVVVIRLGGSLLGLQVFAGADLLTARAPWNGTGQAVATVNPYVGDTIDYFSPGFLEAQRRFLSGDFPWWSADAGPGVPLLSSVTMGMATPITGWFLLLPTVWALGFVKLLQLLVAFTGMLAWLRRIGVATGPSMFAGLAYCGTGFFVGWSNWIPQTTSAALIPVLFWATERFCQERRLTAALPLAATVAFLLLAGFPAAAGHALYAAAGYFVVRLLADRRGTAMARLRSFGVGVGAVLLGAAIAAFQLVTLAGQLATTDLGYRGNQFFGDLPFHSLLSTVLPRAFTVDGYPASNAIESYAFLGVGTLLLAAVGVTAVRIAGVARGVVGYLVAGLIVTSAIVWFQGWWTDWLADVPVLAQNAPGRLRDLVALFACALAGIGCHALLRADIPAIVARRRAVLVTVLGACAVLVLAGLYLHYRGQVKDPSGLAWDVALGILAAVLIVAAALTWRRRALPVAAMSLAAVVVGVQMIVTTAFYWPTADADEFFPDNGLIRATQAHVAHDRALQMGTFLGSTAGAYDIRTVTGHTFQPEAWADFLLAIDPKAYTPPGRTPTNPGLSVDLAGPSIRNPLLDRLGARWVVANPGRGVPGGVRNLDGSPVEGTPVGGRVTVPSGGTVELPTVPGPMRGLQLKLPAAVPRGTPVRLDVQLTTGSELVASGALAVNGAPAGWLTVPVAGEDVTGGSAPATFRVRNDGPPITFIGLQGPAARVVTPAPDTLRLTYADAFGTLWERTTALPRIRWADTAQVIGDRSVALTALSDPGMPAGKVVLDGPAEPADGEPGTVTVVTDGGDRIVADVSAAGAGFLVVADPIAVGWSATVDGSPVGIVAADVAFAAVPVPAGTHRVEFRYAGTGLGGGELVSALGVLVFVGIGGYGWIARRRRAGRGSALSRQALDADPTSPPPPSPS